MISLKAEPRVRTVRALMMTSPQKRKCRQSLQISHGGRPGAALPNRIWLAVAARLANGNTPMIRIHRSVVYGHRTWHGIPSPSLPDSPRLSSTLSNPLQLSPALSHSPHQAVGMSRAVSLVFFYPVVCIASHFVHSLRFVVTVVII